ncbi:MAG: RluA family pseudouridine synthase [Saprospiraceae bacterium]
MLDVLIKNNQFIAFNKPSGIAVQPDKTGDPSFLDQAEAYCKHPLQLVHRIDRPVSGIVLFAKSKAAMTALSRQFQARTVDKEYLAVVQQLPPEPEATLVHFLRKQTGKNTVMAFAGESSGSERAELHYRVAGSSERYHLLHIQLLTGRHHQIRSQLAAIGCPIRGDVKYGFRRNNPDHSIQLHAWRLAFDHPVSGSRIQLEAPLPNDPVWRAFAEVITGLNEIKPQ